jgi:hypothetical protein
MAMAGSTPGTIRSLDGSREITIEEFDRMADDGSDEIDEFIDWSKAHRRGTTAGSARVSLDLPLGLLDRLHAEADRRSMTRDALLAEWVAERIQGLDDRAAHDHAAE